MQVDHQEETGLGSARELERIIMARHSTRSFLAQAVDKKLIEEILTVAGWAPSGNNIQPWRVHVVSGAMRQRLVQAVCRVYDAGDSSYRPEYHYYPLEFFEPYLGRRRQSGWGLYGILGIQKGESARMQAQQRKNFEFFSAPVGLMFTIDRRMQQGSWLDYGMFLQNVMLAATARGLASCAQASWIDYHRIIGDLLQFGENEQLVCGMALGYANPQAAENRLVLERAKLQEYVVFHDAEPDSSLKS